MLRTERRQDRRASHPPRDQAPPHETVIPGASADAGDYPQGRRRYDAGCFGRAYRPHPRDIFRRNRRYRSRGQGDDGGKLMPARLLHLSGVTKSFGTTHALSEVDFDVVGGEAHALVGENGAGKSTLLGILSGVVAPDAGSIEIEGRPVAIDGPAHAQALGIGTVFQELSLADSLSVVENIFVGRLPTWHCHAASGLRSHCWPDSQAHGENQLQRVSFPA